jgi:hypothetical protein
LFIYYIPRKWILLVFDKEDRVMRRGTGFLVVGAGVVFVMGFSAQSEARVDVNIGISIPAYRFAAPPALVVIPGTYAYFAPDVDIDIVFYQGFWYRPHEGRWYRARAYNGPWGYIAPARVPSVLIELPPDYRRLYSGHRHIAYREFNRNWRSWERNKYWEKDERWREGRRGERREERRDEHREGERGHRY